MSRAWVAPLVAGLATAAVVFALVALAVGDNGDNGNDGRSGDRASRQATPAEAQPGGTVFARMGCGSCHRLAAAGSDGQIGPDLDQRLPAHDRESLVAVITDSDRTDFSVMPEDFGERMSDAELDALVDFLMAARRDRATD
jgi:cytochrome c6